MAEMIATQIYNRDKKQPIDTVHSDTKTRKIDILLGG